MPGMTPTKRRSQRPKVLPPRLTIGDYYRQKLTGLLPPTKPTHEEYLLLATGDTNEHGDLRKPH